MTVTDRLTSPRRLLPMLMLLVAASAASWADDGSTKFIDGLNDVRKLAVKGRGKAGLAALKKLLAAHERAAYVYPHRADIETLAQRLAFKSQVKEKKPKDVVKGELVKWKEDGSIKIVYTPKTALGDFRRDTVKHPLHAAESLVHVARWSGPIEVRLEGRLDVTRLERMKKSPYIAYYETKSGGFPTMEYVADFEFGAVRKNRGLWGSLHLDGPEPGEWAGEVVTVGKPGGKYTMTLKVGKSQCVVVMNGKKLYFKRQTGSLHGRVVAFEGVRWSKLTISGTVDPSWINGKIRADVAKQRKTFDRTFRAMHYLPGWLFQKPKGS